MTRTGVVPAMAREYFSPANPIGAIPDGALILTKVVIRAGAVPPLPIPFSKMQKHDVRQITGLAASHVKAFQAFSALHRIRPNFPGAKILESEKNVPEHDAPSYSRRRFL
jgi:hypothetical protein